MCQVAQRVIAKACLRQGSFALGNRGIATTGGRSAPQKTGLRCGRNQTFNRAINMSDDELAAIASGATLPVVK